MSRAWALLAVLALGCGDDDGGMADAGCARRRLVRAAIREIPWQTPLFPRDVIEDWRPADRRRRGIAA